MNKNDIKQIIFEEIEAALKEMGNSPEMMAAQSFIDDEELDDKRAADAEGEDDITPPGIEDMSPDPIFGANPSYVEEELDEMARTANVFKIKDGAGLKDVLQFMQRVNNILKTYKSPGQKRPKKRFTPEEMKALAKAMVQGGGFTSKDVIAATSYSSPAQANKFLKALEMKGLIKLTSQLKKAQEPTRDPNAPETRGRKRRDAEFDMADDPTMMDFGDFDDLDLGSIDALEESAASNLELKKIGKEVFTTLKRYTKGQVKITYETLSFVPDPNADPNALGGGVKNYGVKSKGKTSQAGFGWGGGNTEPQIDVEIDERDKIPALVLKYSGISPKEIKKINDDTTEQFKDKIAPHPQKANTWLVRGSKGRDASGMAPGQRVDTKNPGRYTGQAISENNTTMITNTLQEIMLAGDYPEAFFIRDKNVIKVMDAIGFKRDRSVPHEKASFAALLVAIKNAIKEDGLQLLQYGVTPQKLKDEIQAATERRDAGLQRDYNMMLQAFGPGVGLEENTNTNKMTNLEKYIKKQIRESKEEILNETPYFGPEDLQFTLQLAQTLGMSVKAMNMAIAAASPVLLTGLIFLSMAAEEGSVIAKKKLTRLLQKLKKSGTGAGEEASADVSATEPVSENEGEEPTPEEIEGVYDALMKKVGGLTLAKVSKMREPIREAKNPLAKKMKEIENQGRVAALETKLAAIAEMIEETNGRLTRIDEDNEFADMMDRNAVREVRKQLKELERAQAKLQKEYAKAQGKGGKRKEVVDEVGLEEDTFELNESVKRMQKLANLKG